MPIPLTPIAHAAGRAFIAFVIAASAAFADDQEFRRGLSAFNRGAYAEALADWAASANAGEADSQAGLAFMYFKGMGVAQDRFRAAELYKSAAAKGQPEAQMFLGAIYLYGEGLGRDLVQAYAWCEIAQANGALGALGCREAAERQMSTPEIDAALGLVSKWHREHQRPAAR